MKVNYKDTLIVDPCYIKNVTDSAGDARFDALKHVKTLHDGDDGEYPITYVTDDGEEYTEWLGVDSGRIWMLQAEFDCDVEIDAGYSNYIVGRIVDARKGE